MIKSTTLVLIFIQTIIAGAFSQVIDFEVIHSAKDITVDDIRIGDFLKGPDNEFYFFGSAFGVPGYKLFKSETISSHKQEIEIPHLDGSYKLMLHFDELVLYGRTGQDSYVLKNGIWESKSLFLENRYNAVYQNKMFRYESENNTLLVSNDKGETFTQGYMYDSLVVENLSIYANHDFVYNIVQKQKINSSRKEIYLYTFDTDLILLDSIYIKDSSSIPYRFKMWSENEDELIAVSFRELLIFDLPTKTFVSSNKMNINQGYQSDFLEMNVEKRGRLLYYYNSQGLNFLNLDEVPNEDPIHIADVNLHFDTPYIKDGQNLVCITQLGRILVLDQNNQINYILPNLDPFHQHNNFLIGPDGQLHLYVTSRLIRGGFQSYDQGDTWIQVEDRYLDEYEVDLDLESYPIGSLIQINGDTTACVRVMKSCDPAISKPQSPYDEVTNSFVGNQFYYTTDKGNNWAYARNFVGEPNTKMITVDGLLHIYSPVQSMPEFPVTYIIVDPPGVTIRPTWNIYDPKKNFDLVSSVQLENYILGETNGSFRVNENGELHQHPLLVNDYSYIDDEQLTMSPAGELHLVPSSDASYVINTRNDTVQLYYRQDRYGDYFKLNVSPINLEQGQLHVAADKIYYETTDNIYRASHPIFEKPNSVIVKTICTGDTLEGYSSTGTYIDVFASANGLDSTRTLHLEVTPPLESWEEVYLCPAEKHNGLTDSGIYDFMLTSLNGCDSIHHVEILEIDRDDPICALKYDEEAKSFSDSQFLISYPNPASNEITIHVSKSSRLPSELFIYTFNNKLIAKHQILQNQTTIDISKLETGIYVIYLKNGNNIYFDRIIKIN